MSDRLAEALNYYEHSLSGTHAHRRLKPMADAARDHLSCGTVTHEIFHYCKTHDRKAVPSCWNSVGTPIEGHGRICEIETYEARGTVTDEMVEAAAKCAFDRWQLGANEPASWGDLSPSDRELWLTEARIVLEAAFQVREDQR